MTSKTQRESGWIIPEEPFPVGRVCVQFEIPDNLEYRAYARATVQRLGQWFNWKRSYIEGDRTAVQISQMFKQLLFETFTITDTCEGNNEMFLLRQSPDDPCLLQQSIDGGVTWLTAFNYALCGAGGGGTTNINISIAQTYIQDLRDIYNIDINLIGAKLGNNDASTNSALCHALGVLVRGALSGALERIRSGNNQNLLIQAVGGGVAIASAFIFGTPVAGFATAVGVAVGLVASAVINNMNEQEIEDVLNSPTLLKELQCCAYQALVNTKPTELSFSQAFSNCTDLSPQASNMIPVLQDVVSNFDAFLAFMEGANQAYDYAENGILGNSCENCISPCYDMSDLTNIDIILGSQDPLQGDPPPSIKNASGVNSAEYPLNASGTTDGIATAIRINFTSRRDVNDVTVKYLMNASGTAGLVRGVEVREFGTGIVLDRKEAIVSHNDNNWHETTFAIDETFVGEVVVWISKTSDPATSGLALITEVCIL